MSIHLTRAQIDLALPRIRTGLAQYQSLQQRFRTNGNAHNDPEFRRRYNHFYKVRRNAEWRETFFGLMGEARREGLQLSAVLDALQQASGKLEASFASKLVATINPSLPVIDKFVLLNVGLFLPGLNVIDRVGETVRVHTSLRDECNTYLRSKDGRYLVREFNKMYPNTGVTEMKMLDLVLWQTRA